MARTVTCPAGEWTAIFDHMFVQIPNGWVVTFSIAGDGVITGEVIEKRSSWIFPGEPKVMPLEPVMTFERGWWNTFYSVRVKPEHDLIARIE